MIDNKTAKRITTKKQTVVTQSQDRFYINETEYSRWDCNTQRYTLFAANKSKLMLYDDVNLVKLMGDNTDYAGKVLNLLYHMDKDNMLVLYNNKTRRAYPISQKEDLYKICGYRSRNKGNQFLNILYDKNILCMTKTVTKDGTYLKYWINPCLTMRVRGVTLETYKLFKESIDKCISATAKEELEQLLYIENTSGMCDITGDVTLSDGEKQAIFSRLILRDQPARTYQLIDGSMIKHDMTADNDTYFTVNQAEYKATKPKGSDITGYNSWYIDIDAGKDTNGNYFTIEEVAERKEKMLQIIYSMPTPTAIVSTRNGYHVYYSCENVHTAAEWQQIEDQLISTARISDKAVRDAGRLLRLPGSTWVKRDKGLPAYNVTIADANDITYTASDMAAALNTCSANTSTAAEKYLSLYPAIIKETNNMAPVSSIPVENQTARIQAIIDLSTDTFAIPIEATEVTNINEYVHRINLAEFLQIENPVSFKCIMHADKSPSASIYSNENGYRYYCGCPDCSGNGDGKGIDIIDIVMILSDCKYQQAINYISNIYRIKLATAA